MTHVFVRMSYGILSMPGVFDQLHYFTGPFHIEQTMQQGYNKEFDIWFFTDKVDINEGDQRQVDITCTRQDGADKLTFEIRKL